MHVWRKSHFALSLATLVLASALPHLCYAADHAGYLGGALPGYSSPKPPTPDSPADLLDRMAVHAAQINSGPKSKVEAFEDAVPYGAAQIAPLFSVAAGAPLSAEKNPILTYVLKRAMADVSAILRKEKLANLRDRPYVRDHDISPCYLQFVKSRQSYPSGHAANGYAIAAVIAEVFPSRAQHTMARGFKYGDNRVVCGVHHPIDVAQGRLVAKTYIDVLLSNAEFESDIDCAKHEAAVNAGKEKETDLSKACQDLKAKAQSTP